MYADITVDFEPLPGETGFEFINNLTGDAGFPPEFVEAIAEGLRQELSAGAGHCADPPAPAIRAVLTRARRHEVDSSASAFRIAAQRAVRVAAAHAG